MSKRKLPPPPVRSIAAPRRPRAARRHERPPQPELGQRVFAAQVDDAGVGAAGESGDRHRLDDRERILFEQQPVLEGAGLRLVGVADHVAPLLRCARHRFPLASGWKGGAAAPEELRGDELGDDPRRPELHSPRQSPVAAGLAIGVEARWIDGTDPCQEPERSASGLRHRTPERCEPDRGSGEELGRIPLERAGDRQRVADRAERRRLAQRSGMHDERRRGALAKPEAGAANPRAVALAKRSSGRTELTLELGADLLGAAQAAGEVVADMGHRQRSRRGGEEVVEGHDSPGVGRRHRQPLADVVERAFAHPADAILDGVQGGQQEVAPIARRPAAMRRAAVALHVARGTLPAGGGGAEEAVHGGALFARRLGAVNLDVHLTLPHELGDLLRCRSGGCGQRFDADRRRLELGGAGDRVDGVDGQEVRRHLFREMEGHEGQTWAQRRIDVDRRLEAAAPRADAYPVAVPESEPRGVLGARSSVSPRRVGEA